MSFDALKIDDIIAVQPMNVPSGLLYYVEAPMPINMNFKVKDLLHTLMVNRDKHAATATKMRDDYKKAFKAILQKKLAKLEAGEEVDQQIRLTQPFDYLESYDEVIEMLGSTTDEAISLNQEQFKCYARDQWPSKQHFDTIGSSYLAHI
jgi:hypothetical protein